MALTCPTCRATYDDGLTYCPADGSQLRHSEPEAPPSDDAVVAPAAAAPVYAEPVAAPVAAAPTPPAASASTMSGALVGGLVGLVVVLGGILAVTLMKDDAPETREQVVAAGEPFGTAASGVAEDDSGVQPTAVEPTPEPPPGPADRDLTTQTARPSQPSRSDVSNGPARVVTDGVGLLLRSGPGTGYGILAKMLNDDVVMVGDCQGGRPGTRWCGVVYGGVSGYVLDEYLSDRGVSQDSQTGLEQAFASSNPIGVSAYIDGTEVSYVNLRARPFAGAEVLTKMRLGTSIEVVRCLPYGWSLGGQSIEGRWCFVNSTSSSGRTVSGWASDGALRW